MAPIPDIPAQISFPKEEQKILAFWKEIDAFQTSMKLSEGRKLYTFYDGPPFATGLPHYGHILAGTIKDTVTRYAYQTGHHVERRFGWDCHGLPVEHEIDKNLGIRGPEDVMKMGIKAYNAECRAIVMRYSSEWEETVTRMGRWIDFKNDYKTLNTSFMESVWWVFQELFKKGQVYRGHKIMPYSNACTTPLSNFEANQNFKDVDDPSVVISFPLRGDPSVAFLAWTTTPWTLPSNLALCVNPTYEYVKIRDEDTGSVWILLQSRLQMLYKDPKTAKFTVIEKILGSKLKGIKYIPPFDYFIARPNSFVVMADTYVTDDAGTGVVHCAPAFGEDDFRVCKEHGVVSGDGEDTPCPIDAGGRFTAEVRDYAGQYIKDADKPIQVELKKKGRLVRQSQFNHSYPHCWRSETPLIYRLIPSWFVRVANIRDKLTKNNATTHWVPEFVKERRFADWLENARDWNISRNRYWGTPIPLWISDDGEEIVCVGSVKELEEFTGASGITDLHRDNIDHLTIPSRQGKGSLKRISEVLDCWFESGSMPFAQHHYPFENAERFNEKFPADFIAEGLDQTRGWFYTLMVLSTHLYDKAPWKNLIVNGLVLAKDGKKMSKSKKNFPDPHLILEEFGADVLRLYLISSPVVRAEPIKFDEKGLKSMVANVFLPWYNAYRFFFAQLALLKKEHNYDFVYTINDENMKLGNVMDRWILASTQSLIKFVREEMAAYRLYTVVPRLLRLIDELTNWYVRFNRKRLKGENGIEDASQAMNALFEVLFTLCKMMAPFCPFLAETMYQNLRTCVRNDPETDTRSVHFLMFPEVKSHYFDDDIERAVSRMQSVIDNGRYIREKCTLPVKTPLREIIVINPDPSFRTDITRLESYIKEELNVKTVTATADEESYGVTYELKPDSRVLGQRLGKEFANLRNSLKSLTKQQIHTYVQTNRLTLENGMELLENDMEVLRLFQSVPGSTAKYESTSRGGVLAILDIASDEQLVLEGLAREVVNRTQRLRKKAGLQPVDDVKYFFKLTSDKDGKLAAALESQADYVSKTLRGPYIDVGDKILVDADIIAAEEQEVDDSKFLLWLIKQ